MSDPLSQPKADNVGIHTPTKVSSEESNDSGRETVYSTRSVSIAQTLSAKKSYYAIGYAIPAYVAAFVVLRFTLEPAVHRIYVEEKSILSDGRCFKEYCSVRVDVFKACDDCKYLQCDRKVIRVRTRLPIPTKDYRAVVDIDVSSFVIHPQYMKDLFQTSLYFHNNTTDWAVNLVAMGNSTTSYTIAYSIFKTEQLSDPTTTFVENVFTKNYTRVLMQMDQYGIGAFSLVNEFGGLTFGVRLRQNEREIQLHICSQRICRRYGQPMSMKSGAGPGGYDIEIVQFIGKGPNPCDFKLPQPIEAKAACRLLGRNQSDNFWMQMD